MIYEIIEAFSSTKVVLGIHKLIRRLINYKSLIKSATQLADEDNELCRNIIKSLNSFNNENDDGKLKMFLIVKGDDCWEITGLDGKYKYLHTVNVPLDFFCCLNNTNDIYLVHS